MVYISMVDVNIIITVGFYQWKRVLACSTIMGLKCKLYLKVFVQKHLFSIKLYDQQTADVPGSGSSPSNPVCKSLSSLLAV